MRNVILFTVTILSLVAVLVAYSRPGKDDELAWRMSRSPNFIAIVQYGKRTATRVRSMPDSTKDQLKHLKTKLDSLDKITGLNFVEKRDLVMKFLRANPLMTDSQTKREGKDMSVVFQRFTKEFPEYKKMPGEERSVIFKKAALIVAKTL